MYIHVYKKVYKKPKLVIKKSKKAVFQLAYENKEIFFYFPNIFLVKEGQIYFTVNLIISDRFSINSAI